MYNLNKNKWRACLKNDAEFTKISIIVKTLIEQMFKKKLKGHIHIVVTVLPALRSNRSKVYILLP